MKGLYRPLTLGLLLGSIIFFWTSMVQADWINLSGAENSRNIAEIYVERDHVKVKFEIFIQDVMLFEELIPDQLLAAADAKRPGINERMQRFAERKFQIITDTGERLPARLDLVEPRMRITRPSPLAPANCPSA